MLFTLPVVWGSRFDLSILLTPGFTFFFFQVNSLPADKLQEIQKAIELFSVGQGPAKTMEEASRRSYQFWDTQPVPKLGEARHTAPVGNGFDLFA
jgi:hypothetical protein